MKIFQVVTKGFGRLLFAAETAEGAIDEFRKHVERCDKFNNCESTSEDTAIISVRRLGLLINHKP